MPDAEYAEIFVFQEKTKNLIGKTLINIDNRYHNNLHGRCGVPLRYVSNPMASDNWRDSALPYQIL